MSVDGMESTVLDTPSGAPAQEITSAPAPSIAAPQASGSGASQFGDADLDNAPTIAPPRSAAERARDASGRFAPKSADAPTGDPAAQVQLPPGQPESTPAPQDWLTPEVKSQADFYGFSEAEAREFGSPEKLFAVLTALDRRALRDFGQPQQQPFQGQVPPAGYAPAPAPVAPAQTQAPSGFDLAKYKDTFDPETLKVLGEWDQSVRGELQRRDAELAAVKQGLEQANQQYQSLQQASAQAEARRAEAEMDAQFDSLSKDYEDLFGKGSIRELAPAFQAKRQEFASYMDQLAEMDVRAGRHPAPAKQIFQRVLRTMYGDRQEKAIRNQIAQEVAQRRSQGIARPTARNLAPADPLEAAARRADEIYRKRGFDVPSNDDSFDGVI